MALNVKIISTDSVLRAKLDSTGYFGRVSFDEDIKKLEDTDILIVSDKLVPYNAFIELYDKSLKNVDHIFYMVSKDSINSFNNIKTILASKNVKVIPPYHTVGQIVEIICCDIGITSALPKNIVVFFGADNNVGTTITTQGVAETIAKRSKATIGLLFLNGQPCLDYVDVDKNVRGIDNIKLKVINKVLTKDELVESCIKKDNLYILPGAEAIKEVRHYHPEHIEKLVELASKTFDAVIIDAGCKLGISMSIGALLSTNNRYLITTQSNKVFNNFLRTREQILMELDMDAKDFFLIVNKYISSNEFYSPSQLADRYKTSLAGTIPVIPPEMALLSERDSSTLLKYQEEEYNEQMENISKIIARQLNIDFIESEAHKKSWIQKIIFK